MKTLPALLLTALLVAAFVLATNGPPYSYNHPTNCISCHSETTASASNALSSLTSGASSNCDPTQAECVWSHQVLTGAVVWKQCKNCHSALDASLTSGPGTVHKDLYASYGCACHAVAHVGYGTPSSGYTACIYFYVPDLPNPPSESFYFGDKPTLNFKSVYICFYGTPGGTYQFDYDSIPASLQAVLQQNGKVVVKALNVSYTKYPNGTIIAQGMGARFVGEGKEDFFSALEWAGIFRYENYTAYGAVLRNPKARTHPLTEEAPNGETIILGVFDIHEGSFILVAPYAPYSRAPYYLPAAVNPGVGACFNCHFVYSGQTGTAKVMQVGGVWKIGIPADVLNSLADPHRITLPSAASEGGVAPNLSLVALVATGTLLAGAFVVVKRRL
ncbi:MAG: hypothetical protein QXI07_06710 [Pyrobaculum sp.]